MTDSSKRYEQDIKTVHGNIHCVIEGQGKGLIFLHGALGTGAAHFRDQIGHFADRYKVVAPDFLGYGKSSRRSSFDGNLYNKDAEDIDDLIGKLGFASVDLCGFSDGAIVAMIVAQEYPELLNSLTVIGGQAIFDDDSYEMNQTFVDLPLPVQMALARHHGDPYWKELIESYLYAQENMHKETRGFMVNHLDRISAPTLIVQGESDPWVDSKHSYHLRDSIDGSRLVFFPNIGHEVQREDPVGFNKLLEDFLNMPRR